MLCAALSHIYKTISKKSMGPRSLILLKIQISQSNGSVLPSFQQTRNLPSALLLRFPPNSVVVKRIQRMIWWGEPGYFLLGSLSMKGIPTSLQFVSWNPQFDSPCLQILLSQRCMISSASGVHQYLYCVLAFPTSHPFFPSFQKSQLKSLYLLPNDFLPIFSKLPYNADLFVLSSARRRSRHDQISTSVH